MIPLTGMKKLRILSLGRNQIKRVGRDVVVDEPVYRVLVY
jgi:hypothetical protein